MAVFVVQVLQEKVLEFVERVAAVELQKSLALACYRCERNGEKNAAAINK